MRETESKKYNEVTLAIFSEVGQTLAQARKEQNLTISQVADIIHIRQKYLSDLEDGRLYDLPARVYTLGFIRTYARLLKLDGEELIRQMEAVPDSSGYNRLQMPVVPHLEEEPNYRIITISVILALLVAVGGYSFLKPFVEENPGIEALEAIDRPLRPETTGHPVVLSEPARPEAPVMPEVLFPAEGADDQLAKKLANSVIGQAPSSNKDVLNNILSREDITTIKAVEPTWLEVRDEKGKILLMKVLQRGEEFKLSAQPGIIMNIGNAGGIDIYSGNTKLAPLGARGEVKRGVLLNSLKP